MFTARGKSGTSAWAEEGIMVCRPPAEEGDAPIRAYYAEIVALLATHRGAYVSITDATGIHRVPSARERKLHGELINAMSKDTGGRCRGMVIVVPSAIVRAAVTGVTWLMDQKFPMVAAATLDEALSVARRQLRGV